MIFLRNLAEAVYEFQRYLKYCDDQRQETYAAAAVEKAEAATAEADTGYAVWKEAMLFAALEAERVSPYSTKNAGSPETLEVKRLEAEALEKAYNYAALEEKRAAAALALKGVQSAPAGTDLSSGENAAAAVAAPKADIVPAKQDKPKKKGIFGGMETGFML